MLIGRRSSRGAPGSEKSIPLFIAFDAALVCTVDDSLKSREQLSAELAVLREKVAVGAASPATRSGGEAFALGGSPHETDQLVRDVVASAPVIIWAVDRGGKFLLCEGKTLASIGLEPGEVVGRSVFDLYADYPRICDAVRGALRGQSVVENVEIEGIPFACWHAPLRTARNRVLGVVCVALDVSRYKQTEERLRTEQRRMQAMLSSQERDRRLTAYEIHDGLVQDIAGAQMRLETLLNDRRLPEGPVRQQFLTVSELIRKALGEARHLIGGLRPPILDDLGVVAAIEYLIDEQPADGTWFELEVDVHFDRLEPLLEGTIYRICQEAITNVQRHSRSPRATIRLLQIDDRLRVEIRDWGVGFRPGEIHGNRLGLQGIRERARLLHGWAEIDSEPGQGTRVCVELPLANIPMEFAITNDRSIE